MPCPAKQVKTVGTLGAVTWVPNTPDEGNLEGTCRTLDNISGATLLKPGLISRAGWVVVDDSATPLLDAKAGETRGATHLRGGGGSAAAATGSSDDASPWDTEPWPVARPAPTVVRDWYFFGHGASTGVGGCGIGMQSRTLLLSAGVLIWRCGVCAALWMSSSGTVCPFAMVLCCRCCLVPKSCRYSIVSTVLNWVIDRLGFFS